MFRLPPSPALRVMTSSVKQHRPRVVAAVALALVSGAAGIGAPLLISRLITALGRHTSLTLDVLELAGVAVAGAFAAGWSSYLLSSAGERSVARVRVAVAAHAMRLPLTRIRGLGAGEIVSRLVGDAAALRSVTDTAVTALPLSVVMVAACLTMMGILDWILLLVTIGTFAVAAVAIRAFLAGMRRGAQRQQTELGLLAQSAQSTFTMASTIKAYRAEQRALAPLERKAEAAATAATRTARAQAAIAPLMGLGQQAAIIGVLAVGGKRLADGSLSIADFMAFLMYLFQLVNPLMMVAQGMGRIQVGVASALRLDQILAAPAEPARPGPVPAPVPGAPAIVLDGVDVELSGRPVLRGLSFAVPARGVVAVVGLSGAGKSTLFNVLEGFVETTAGRVELLGRVMADWPLAAARQRIALVEQGGAVLDLSVRDNLALGREDRPADAELWDALRVVGLEDAVGALPAGLDTVLGAGVRLSGGELQRLAIARAVLTDAEVLLLDEPSAHLDGENDARLVALLERLGQDRAVVVITHRMTTACAAETIAVLAEGRIVAVGDHAALLAECPAYQVLALGEPAGQGEPARHGEPARPGEPARQGV